MLHFGGNSRIKIQILRTNHHMLPPLGIWRIRLSNFPSATCSTHDATAAYVLK